MSFSNLPSGTVGTQDSFSSCLDDLELSEYEFVEAAKETTSAAPDSKWQPYGQQGPNHRIPILPDDRVRNAVLEYIAKKKLSGSKFAREVMINDIRKSSIYHYCLETFGEKRESSWITEPYDGLPIDGAMNGPVPSLWDVMVVPEQYFQDSTLKMAIPHTTSVKPCHMCVGNGRICCERCFGRMQDHCIWCNGVGHKKTIGVRCEPCSHCNSTGRKRCFSCSGTGQIRCKICSGKGSLKIFLQLTVTWVNHVKNFISPVSTVPEELICKAVGQVEFDQQLPRVTPITDTSDPLINKASHNFIVEHSQAFSLERILQQRQQLRIVPIAGSDYQWKTKSGQFCVYGLDYQVYIPGFQSDSCNVL